MVNIIIELSKYIIIIMITMYTFMCFSIFGFQDPDRKKGMLRNQNILMFMIHIIAFLIMYLETDDIRLLAFYLMQVVLFGATILLYTFIYPKVSRLVINNMCMLLSIGFLILSRLSFGKAVKQFEIVVIGMVLSFIVPVIVRKVKILKDLTWLYGIVGLALLMVVLAMAAISGEQS